ncbi:serine O-acetyltransferase [Geodermatophilus sp. SYSU D00815]
MLEEGFLRTLRADYAVNEFFDARATLLVWRAGQALRGRPGVLAFLLRRVCQVADFVWTRGYIGADLPFSAIAGPGIRLPHGGRGTVLHPTVRIGARAVLYHQVTIGVREEDPAATLGDDVFIGAGAKIIGTVHLGDGCRVGANAVVLTDVPPGATAVGVPASIRRKAGDAAAG